MIARLPSDMDTSQKIPRMSSDMDATAGPGTPHPETSSPGTPSPSTPSPGTRARGRSARGTTSSAPRPEAPPGWRSSELADALNAVLNAIPDVRAGVAHRLGLNLSEVDAMQHLMTEPVGPVELSRRLHMTSASATVLVDRLEEAGHVVREPDPSDGRRRVVRPTEQGQVAVFEQIRPMVSDLIDAEEGLTPRERTAVLAYLERVLEVLRAHTDTW